MIVLGLDTGTEGALVVLSAEDEAAEIRPVFAGAWAPSGDRWSASWSGPGISTRRQVGADTLVGSVARLASIGLAPVLRDLRVDGRPGVDAVVFEGAYIGPNPRSALAGARIAGGTLAALEVSLWMGRAPPVREISNGSWWSLSGFPGSVRTRDDRKAESLERVPALIPGLRELLAQVHGGDHATDAAAIARIGIRHGAVRGTQAEWSDRLDVANGKTARSIRKSEARAKKPSDAAASVRITRGIR